MLMSFHFSPLKGCRAILEGNKLNVKLIAKIITCFLQEFLCFCCFTGYDNVNLHFFLTNNRTLNSLEGGRFFFLVFLFAFKRSCGFLQGNSRRGSFLLFF